MMKKLFDIFNSYIVLVGNLGIIATMLALPTWLLWNALVPDIFGLARIGFMQAIGINLLTLILFKLNIQLNPPNTNNTSDQSE
jgi:hypothetical protein